MAPQCHMVVGASSRTVCGRGQLVVWFRKSIQWVSDEEVQLERFKRTLSSIVTEPKMLLRRILLLHMHSERIVWE